MKARLFELINPRKQQISSLYVRTRMPSHSTGRAPCVAAATIPEEAVVLAEWLASESLARLGMPTPFAGTASNPEH